MTKWWWWRMTLASKHFKLLDPQQPKTHLPYLTDWNECVLGQGDTAETLSCQLIPSETHGPDTKLLQAISTASVRSAAYQNIYTYPVLTMVRVCSRPSRTTRLSSMIHADWSISKLYCIGHTMKKTELQHHEQTKRTQVAFAQDVKALIHVIGEMGYPFWEDSKDLGFGVRQQILGRLISHP